MFNLEVNGYDIDKEIGSILSGAKNIDSKYEKLANVFVDISTEILSKEGYKVKVEIVPDVWATYANKTLRQVQYGELMFVLVIKNGMTQARNYFYCFPIIDSNSWMCTTISNSDKYKLPIPVKLASILLEETSHIVAPHLAHHGEEFTKTFTMMWIKYMAYILPKIKEAMPK